MPLLKPDETRIVSDALRDMTAPVRILFFTQALGCETCAPTRQILDAVLPLNDKLTLEEVNFILDKEKVAAYGIDRVPALVFEAGDVGRLRMYGVPSGYEFMSLIEALRLVSRGDSGLSAASRAQLARVTEPVHVQVFSTPT